MPERSRPRSVGRRLLAPLTATALCAVGAITLTAPAAALTVDEPTFSFEGTVNGDYILVGNGVLECFRLADGRTVGNSGTCAQLHNGTVSPNPQIINDWFVMGNAQGSPALASDGAANSSVAQVTIPDGASIVHAHLYWSASTGIRNTAGASAQRCAGPGPNATLPPGSYAGATVKLQAGSGTPVIEIAPSEVHAEPITALPDNQPQYYSASADVTSAFASLPSGSVQNIAVGDIWAANGPGCHAGWTLALVYDFGDLDLANPETYARNVILYDGHVRMFSDTTPQTVRFDGFEAAGPGTRAGFNLYAADLNILGDYAEYSTQSQPSPVRILRLGGATNNIGVSQADGSLPYGSNPAIPWTNVQVDVINTTLGSVATGDQFVDLTLGTNGDSYLLQMAALSVPVANVRIDKSFDGDADQQWRTADDPAFFTVTVTNTGSVPLSSDSTIITDENAPLCERLDGVASLVGGPQFEPGDSFTYTCEGRAPGGSGYVNVIQVDATPVGLTTPVTATDTSNVGLSRILLTKNASLAPGSTGNPGDTVVFTFTVTNTGDSLLSGVVIADLFPGVSAITYGDWPGAPGILAPSESVTVSATYILTQDDVNAGRIENSAITAGIDPLGTQVSDPGDDALVVAPAPAIDVTKVGSLDVDGGVAAPGDLVTYTFDVINTGNVTLTDVRLDDPLPGLGEIVFGEWPNAPGVLNAGESVQASATYQITQDDIDAAAVENTVTVAGDPPTGPPAENDDTEIVPIPIGAGIDLVKRAELPAIGARLPGDLVTYTFEVTNVGNATLFDVEVTDPLPGLSEITFGPWPDPADPGTLQPGGTVLATATYSLTQTDIDFGRVDNTATATGEPEVGDPVESDDPAETIVPRGPHIVLEKFGALAEGAIGQVGDVVEFAFEATNTGNVPLTGVVITDPLEGLGELTYTWPGEPGTLLPGQSVEATASYELTLDDVDNGGVTNVATTTGTPPPGSGGDPEDGDESTVPLTAQPQIEIVKSGELAEGATGTPGDQIVYAFEVANAGNVTLSNVSITDELEGISLISYGQWPGVEGVLDPGESVTATATYGVRAADADAGLVTNVASVTGGPPSGEPVEDEDLDTVIVDQVGISIIKDGELAEEAEGAVGDVVTYAFLVTNTGSVTLNDVTITDDLEGLSEISYDWPGAAGVLLFGQSVSASATYVLTQADLDNGGVQNLAVATGTSPLDVDEDPTDEDEHEILLDQDPSVELEKSGVLPPGADGEAGDEITYTFTATNTGNVTLADVEIIDPRPGLSEITYLTWVDADGEDIAPGTLPPGGVVTAVATYVLTQGDVDGGGVDNTATVVGTPPGEDARPVDGTGDATVVVPARPQIEIVKSGELAEGAESVAGDLIGYTFTATNVGNVTLADVEITDPLPGLSEITYLTWVDADGEAIPAGSLPPGGAVTATAAYALTQEDVDAGEVENTATAFGTPPGEDEPVEDEGTNIRPVPRSALIELVKTGVLDDPDAERSEPDDGVTYTFTATNTGTVTLADVEITDPLPGLSEITYVSWVDAYGEAIPAGSLPPGGVVTATAAYALTQADIDAGGVDNTATVEGTPPASMDIDPVTDTDDEFVPAATVPDIEIVKSGDLAEDATAVAGDAVEYAFTVTNTGNVTLTGVTITDDLEGLSEIGYDWPGADGVLAPGEVVIATATYLLTQDDVDAGERANSASVEGTPAPNTGTPPTDEDEEIVPVPQLPAISLLKSGALAEGAAGETGDEVTYTFEVTNTGNVTLTGVRIDDPLEGLSEIVFGQWPGQAGVLAPGESVTARATYVLTQDDVDAGQADNVATTFGTPPGEDPEPVQDTGDATVPVEPGPGIDLVKQGSLRSGATSEVGDYVDYTFTVTNTGNVTLTGVRIDDPLEGLSEIVFGQWPGQAGVLAPGESVTATATWALSQGAFDAGEVANTATAIGNPPGGQDPVESEDAETLPLPVAPAIDLQKSGSPAQSGPSSVGDELVFTFVATNTGNVTLTDVLVIDDLDGLSAITYDWPGVAGVLAPGQGATATATYALTSEDIDRAEVHNAATVTGQPSTGGDPVEDGGETLVEVELPVPAPPTTAPPTTAPPTTTPDTGVSGLSTTILAMLFLVAIGAGLLAVRRGTSLG